MKEIRAKLVGIRRKGLSGGKELTHPYDDNTIVATFSIAHCRRPSGKVVEGPATFLNRRVRVEMGISEFVGMLPQEVKLNLYVCLREECSSKPDRPDSREDSE